MIKILKYTLSILIVGVAMPISGITYLFSHGLAATEKQAYWYAKKDLDDTLNHRHIIDNEEPHGLKTFNYPDAHEGLILTPNLKRLSMRINRYHTSFAQENEINVLNEAHAAIETDIVGVGISRGASALNMLCSQKDKNNIKALVLESPFDSMDSVMRNMLGEFLYKYATARAIGHSLIRFVFSQYNKEAATPLQAAETIPLDLPILIICSEEDTRVPAASSENLYKKLRETGHNNVHLIKLKHGAHGKLIHGVDGETYRNVVHAFYQKYDLPHDEQYAKLGKDLFEESQSH